VRRHPMSPLRGFKTHFDHDFLGLTPQAIRCRRSAADLRNFKTYASGYYSTGFRSFDGNGKDHSKLTRDVRGSDPTAFYLRRANR